MRSTRRAAALAVATAALVVLPGVASAQFATGVAATGRAHGVFKPFDCNVSGPVAFATELEEGHGALDFAPVAVCGTGDRGTIWLNFCRGDVGERVVCGDGDLEDTTFSTAILEANGTFVFENENWRLEGELVRQGARI